MTFYIELTTEEYRERMRFESLSEAAVELLRQLDARRKQHCVVLHLSSYVYDVVDATGKTIAVYRLRHEPAEADELALAKAC